MDIWKELEAEGVNRHLLAEVRSFRDAHGVAEEVRGRIPNPRFVYYGKDVWEAAAAAVLCGENLLLAGPKATGKNVLAENLAALFGRPVWDISMHINVDAASLIGTDTLKGGEVCFREGPVCQCARLGGFGILATVLIVLPPMLECAAWTFCLSLCVMAADMLELKTMSGLLTAVRSVTNTLIGLLASCSLFMIIATSIMTLAGRGG